MQMARVFLSVPAIRRRSRPDEERNFMSSHSAADAPPVPRAGDIDPEAAVRLEGWMARNIQDHEGPATIERLAGGQSNPTFRVSTPRRDYILRRKPPGELL